MNGVVAKAALLSFCAVLIAPHFLTDVRPEGASTKPSIIRVDKVKGHAAFTVDSKPSGAKPTDDLLHALGEIAEKKGVDHPVLVYLDSRLPMDEIWDVEGVAGKAQLNNLRFFVFSWEDHVLTEITWKPFSRFTTLPPTN